MRNQKYFPFDRNKFFYGKLLTVRDFQSEQKYFNDKRRLINRALHGVGIVCGLDIIQVDDQSVSLEMGVALDYGGREIVVDNPIIKKLSMIEGFLENENADYVYLCIEYDEEEKEPIHAMVNSSAKFEDVSEFNRYREGYKLIIKTEEPDEEELTFKGLVSNTKIIYKSKDITIKHITPRYVNPLKEFELKVIIEKHHRSMPILLKYELDTDHFVDENGNNKIKIAFDESKFEMKDQYEINYRIKANHVKNVIGNIRLNEESFHLKKGEKIFGANTDGNNEVSIIEEALDKKVMMQYYGMHMDRFLANTEKQNIYLAKIELIRAGTSYMIKKIEKNPFAQYVLSPSILSMMQEIQDRKSEKEIKKEEENKKNNFSNQNNQEEQLLIKSDVQYKTGTCTINFGLDPKYHNSYFSDEIIHELGPGNVCIYLAIEQKEENSLMENQLIFGNSDIFNKTAYEPKEPKVSLGAIAYVDKGTFRIGAKLMDITDADAVHIRWWAYKKDMENLREHDQSMDIRISIKPDAITTAPRGRVNFTAEVKGIDEQTCKWSVKEEDGGVIDENGVYIAPSKEGVYEIIAQSEIDETKEASAFVVVEYK
ncbi:hypothetical protein [Crassaminicella profunda]|uniref:hypothetical protein n=1 Tax=Crassaminicella profunda TaxID=1286698 RepID=UPI001CA75008|nr:hypothetical protein [Crassaminicella profunda]QZY54468.1 hypothetical protein K7H06_15695 [Crassaminicella profunda]